MDCASVCLRQVEAPFITEHREKLTLRTVVHRTVWSRAKIPTLSFTVCALGAFGSATRAADAVDTPSTETPPMSVDTDKRKKPKEKGLPHRQEWELFRQGNSPARDCPGATAMLIEVAGTVFFLECQRIHP